MNDEIVELLRRQAEWQRSRVSLTWAEKLRQSVALRQSLAGLRKTTAPVPAKASRG